MARSGAVKGFGSWCRDPAPQLPLAILPQIFISSSAAEGGALTQTGDVGPPTRWRHDTLGVPARNVVVHLSACEIKRKVGYSRLCLQNTKQTDISYFGREFDHFSNRLIWPCHTRKWQKYIILCVVAFKG